MVVPLAPGGPADVLARLIADRIGQAQGVTAVVENRPGGGTVIGTEAVSRATPDGNTGFEPICYLVRSQSGPPGDIAESRRLTQTSRRGFTSATGSGCRRCSRDRCPRGSL